MKEVSDNQLMKAFVCQTYRPRWTTTGEDAIAWLWNRQIELDNGVIMRDGGTIKYVG